MVIIKDKFIIDFYIPILRNEYSQTLLLLGYKKEQLTGEIKSYTIMIFGIRFLFYKERK